MRVTAEMLFNDSWVRIRPLGWMHHTVTNNHGEHVRCTFHEAAAIYKQQIMDARNVSDNAQAK